MVADVARRVGGEDVEVHALMGPGVDPHLFRATPRHLDALKAADLVLYSGKGLEGKMGDILVNLASRKTVLAVTDGISDDRLLEPPELEGHFDPHVWFDVALWAETVAPVADALSKLDPEHEDAYRARARAYRDELLALHAEVAEAVATIPAQRRVLLTSHDAFRYFGRAYDLEVRGLQGVSTAQEAGVRDRQEMAKLIVERGIKAVFVETSVNAAGIRAVQEAVASAGGSVTIGGTLYSDAMGDTPPEDTYVGMVRANVRTIVEALR
jgi:manganese/zinc/iron transport system substrate-binding protein